MKTSKLGLELQCLQPPAQGQCCLWTGVYKTTPRPVKGLGVPYNAKDFTNLG